jgi:hypothetical protein
VATASKAGRRQPCLTQGSSASFIAIEGAMHRHKRASSARRGPGGTTPEARRAWSRQHGRRAARQGPVPRTACVAWAEKRLGGPKSWGACVGPRLDVRARGDWTLRRGRHPRGGALNVCARRALALQSAWARLALKAFVQRRFDRDLLENFELCDKNARYESCR